MNPCLLKAENVTKHFGGLAALSEVSLAVRSGEIYGMIGPNGAGKTTLFNILTGLYNATAGAVSFAGRPLLGLQPHEVVRSGLARTFQNIRLFANMTALENVMVGQHSRTRTGVLGAILRNARARGEEAAMKRLGRDLLDFVGIGRHGGVLARHLSYGDQRRLEIARALATEPRLLALDEPAAGMNPNERAGLQILLRAVRDSGVTLLLIEHDVNLVMGLCDRVVVLDYGKKIAEGLPDQVRKDPKVIEAYLGAAHAPA